VISGRDSRRAQEGQDAQTLAFNTKNTSPLYTMASLRVSYKIVENVEIPTDIYLPDHVGSKPAPVLIM